MSPAAHFHRPQPRLAMRTLALLLAAAGTALAAPSTRLETEFFVPLESDSKTFALADVATGEVRLAHVDGDGEISSLGRFPTHLPDITGLISGFDISGTEYLVAANVTGNRLVLAPVDGDALRHVPTLIPGPSHPALLRENLGAPLEIATAARYHHTGHTFELILDAGTAPSTSDVWIDWPVILDFQPARSPDSQRRFAAIAAEDKNGTPIFLTFAQDGFGLSQRAEEPRTGSRLAAGIIGEDGRLLVVAFDPGGTALEFFTLDHGDGSVTLIDGDTAPFPVGAIAPVAVPGQSHGLTLTSADGSVAALAEITDGKTLNILETFPTSPGNRATGLVPIPGIGLVQLERKASFFGPSTFFRTFAESGGTWQEIAAGTLEPYTPAAADFATLFWYQGNPLIDSSASLVSLETRDEWTRPATDDKIPATVFGESFVNATTGLGNPSSFSPTTPGSADHLFTNQFSPSVSLAALQDRNALLAPDLRVSPESGFFEDTIFVTATYDFETQDLYFREDRPGSPWRLYDGGFPVGYNGNFLFYLRPKSGGAPGPIVRRDYSFSFIDGIGPDSDSDGVPDVVERKYHMNPLAGPDSDGDGRSDLEEILDGTDPNDASDFTPGDEADDAGPDGRRAGTFHGDGFRLYAQARTQSTGFASPGEMISLRDSFGALLRSAPVAQLAAPPTLAGSYAATLHQDLAIDRRQWLVLHSPEFHKLGTGSNPSFGGVEKYRVITPPVISPPEISPATFYSGYDLEADADLWIDAARSAYASYEPLEEITDIRPKHNASAVIAEAILYQALETLAFPELPATADGFTLFGSRLRDVERAPFTEAMHRALLQAGFDFPATLACIDDALEAPESFELRILTSAVRNFHSANADTTPGLGFPIDAFRTLLATGDLPADYAGAAPASRISLGHARMLEIIAGCASYRPVETWTIEVQPPLYGGGGFDFTRLPDYFPVRFFDAAGEPFYFAQGLGLRHGTVITVTGYTDLPPTGPYSSPAMELVSVDAVTVPASTDSDTDANFLDDDWELFFFGDIGQNPHDTPPGGSHSYLQHFLAGTDPRDPSSLTGPVLDFGTPALRVVRLLDDTFAIEWDWPTEYADRFDFRLEQTPTLSGFADLALGDPDIHAPGVLRFDLGPTISAQSPNFFRLVISLR